MELTHSPQISTGHPWDGFLAHDVCPSRVNWRLFSPHLLTQGPSLMEHPLAHWSQLTVAERINTQEGITMVMYMLWSRSETYEHFCL